MGCNSPQNATMPNIPASHLNRLLQVSDINHALNVNKKYQHLSRLKEGQLIGNGYKRTLGYDCMTTAQELKSKRKQFWETRVNGSHDCWAAIKSAVEQQNQETGMMILQSLRISMLNNNIQMCVDSKFNKYQVPVFCINEPISFAHETMAQKNLNFGYTTQSLEIKIRCVRWPTEDIILPATTNADIGSIKIALREKKSILDSEQIRFFYNGREMTDNRTLGNYTYNVGTIIQAMIK